MHPTIGIDWEFGVGQHGSNWILERWIVREQGIIVWGPSPKTLIDPVSPDELQTAVCGMLRDFWQAQLDGPGLAGAARLSGVRHSDDVPRALYLLARGKSLTKPEAAAWALQTLDPQMATVDRAKRWSGGISMKPTTMTETLEFLRFAVGTGT